MDEAKRKACRIIGVALAALPLAACLAVLFTPRPVPANLWRPSSVGADGKSDIALSAPSYTATAASGANAFAVATNGARIDFGTGANDHVTSDGVLITFGTNLKVNNQVDSVYFLNESAGAVVLRGSPADGATAIANQSRSKNALATAGAEIHAYYSDDGSAKQAAIMHNGAVRQTGVTFAALGTPVNGTLLYCSDCTIANPCASGGTGAFAKRLNAVWVCN